MSRDPRSDPSKRDEALTESSPEQRVRPHEGRPFLLGTLHPATQEIRELAGTLGLRLVAEVYQGRDRPHPGTFFGKGRLEDLKEAIGELRGGIVPEAWSWEEGEYRTGDLTPGEETAWGGTPWVRGSGDPEDPGERGDSAEWTGDPLSSPGRDDGRGRREGRARPNAAEGPQETDPLRKGGEAPAKPDADHRHDPVRARPAVDDPSQKATKAHGPGRAHSAEGPPDLSGGEGERLLLILNEDVRPAVLFNLEDRLKVEVWDRTRLILEIFGQHAHVKEAKLQVELAMLQYEIPLVHEAVHRRRTGERPGFMGGGEYEVAEYEDFIKRRMRSVKDELERIRQERDVRRKVRREQFYLVSLAGYTNAGKSSLLNALTGASVHQKWEMFSTLETTTRRMADTGVLSRKDQDQDSGERTGPSGHDRSESGAQQARRRSKREEWAIRAEEGSDPDADPVAGAGPHFGEGGEHVSADDPTRRAEGRDPINTYTRPILLTDTVGFIQALPSWLLDAFRSTLEEISVSDVVLLVADVSDPVDVLMEKVRVCREELSFLDVTCPILLVLNKIDLVPREVVEAKRWRLIGAGLARQDMVVEVSSRSLTNVTGVANEVHRLLPTLALYRAEVPADDAGQRFLSLLYQWGEVYSVDYGETTVVEGAADPLHWKRLVREAVESGADVYRRGS